MARMLVTPIGRSAPIVGKGVASGIAALVSFTVLVVASTVLLGSSWGPPLGVAAIGIALSFAAVGVAIAVVSVTRNEEAASQVGTIVSTAWAVFGGVFLALPASGPLASLSRLSPFSWALEGIGRNAGAGTSVDVLVDAAVIALFGAVGVAIAFARRRELARV